MKTLGSLTWILLAALAFPAAARQDRATEEPAETGPAPVREELQAAMEEYFENRLRQSLSLSDEQMDAIVPDLRRLERSKRKARIERQRTLRELQRAYRSGGDDGLIDDLLQRLDAIEDQQHQLQRSTLGKIDESLNARQRVELRFFIHRFQREFGQRVRELRGERRRPRADRRSGRRRP